MVLDVNWWKENVKLLRYSVDVYVDDYEEGQGEQVHDWSETVEDFYRDSVATSESDLISLLNDQLQSILIGGKLPHHDRNAFGFEDDYIYTNVLANYKEGQGMGLYYYPTEQDKEEWKKGEKELYSVNVSFQYETEEAPLGVVNWGL
jgi:hypothetical protein